MNKLFLTMLFCMVLAVGEAYAQDVDTTRIELTTEEVSTDFQPIPTLQMPDVDTVFETAGPEWVVPVKGRSKFAKRHYIFQRLEISTMAGQDKNEEDSDDSDAPTPESSTPDQPNLIAGLNYGLNFGYSLVFVPGQVQDNQLIMNRFGFGYSVGFLSEFDKQKDYGVTCDFMFKTGVETGSGHALGLGIDFLVGGGKSAGVSYLIENDTLSDPDHYTAWCFKYGMQLWLNTSFLTTGLKNSDILAFVRYIRSVDPEDENQNIKDGIYNEWIEESWQFGVTFVYRF
ncbi:MAG: hypothetical protein IJS26_04150 [Alphaproteobacteria bacterium]|nr:hypothetical protein [Alphaproteobacteria bacterium]